MSLIGLFTNAPAAAATYGRTSTNVADDAAKSKKSFEIGAQDPGKKDQAKSAYATGYAYGSATANTLYQAQDMAHESQDTSSAASLYKSITDQFMEYMDKSPEELMREQILKELGYSEEDLAALPADERAKVEEKIRQLIETKIEQSMREKGIDVEIANPAQSGSV